MHAKIWSGDKTTRKEGVGEERLKRREGWKQREKRKNSGRENLLFNLSVS